MGALDYRDKIKALIEQGPVQPQAVAKELSTNSMLASAMLSEMSEKGLLKVSSLKVGSSPLYYSPEHPEHLIGFIPNLNEKDRRTAAQLQMQGVLRDNAQDPLTRVSLRNIKDFAKQLDVTIDGTKETFWKFYLLTDDQAAEAIKKLLQPAPAAMPAPAEAAPAPKPRKPRAKKPKAEAAQAVLAPAAAAAAIAAQAPAVTPAPAALAETPASIVTSAPAAPPTPVPMDDPFLDKLLSFFNGSNITVLEQVVLKKKTEYDFIIQLASPVGQLHYYCKAKNKAKIGEADISHAYVQGQVKKLPVLFLAPGALTKPAQDLLKELKGLTVKQV
jgi:Mn-dependent DtxR family transcriptional regulator